MNTTKRERRFPRRERTSRRTAPSGRRDNKSKLVPRFAHNAMQNKAAAPESQPVGREANQHVSTQGVIRSPTPWSVLSLNSSDLGDAIPRLSARPFRDTHPPKLVVRA